jgi:hypothetical protein
MSALPPPAQLRRRPRRGSLERPINARLYRGGLLFAVLPLFILAFTISSPSPLVKPLLPETFDSASALALTRDLANGYPDRVPGSAGAGDSAPSSGATAWFIQQLEGYGLQLSSDSWHQRVAGLGAVQLANVAAVAAGQSPEEIVVVAHRDDLGTSPGADDNASGSAVLIELARAYAEPRGLNEGNAVSPHTLVFLSTDGDAFGTVGVRHFLATWPQRRQIAAVIDLDALAGAGAPRIEVAGLRPRSPSATLLATASARIAEQSGTTPAHDGIVGQLIDLAFPFTFYGQGPALAAGIPAITLTTLGNRPASSFGDSLGQLQLTHFDELGAAAESLLGSLNQDVELAPSTSSYVWVGSRDVRGWAIEFVLIALLMPIATTLVDLYALCRRHRVPLAPASRRLARHLVWWLACGAVFTCFSLTGLWPTASGHPPAPAGAASQLPLGPLALLAVLFAAGFVRLRRPARRQEPPELATAAGLLATHTVALLLLFLLGLLIAATNPFALIFILPALHLWTWLPQLRPLRLPLRAVTYLAGLAGLALVPFSLALRFQMGLRAVPYLVNLAADRYVTPFALALTLAVLAASGQIGLTALARPSLSTGGAEIPDFEVGAADATTRRGRPRVHKAR